MDTTKKNESLLKDKTFIFITGVEGSGTTMMLKIFDSINNTAVLGGNYWSPSLSPIAAKINSLTEKLWNTKLTISSEEKRDLIQNIQSLSIPSRISHIIYKRSFPFLDKYHYPIISDIKCFSKKTKLIVMNRDIEDNTSSILRRKFETDSQIALDRSVSAYNLLHQQLENHNDSYLNISYEEIIQEKHKTCLLSLITDYSNLENSCITNMAKIIETPTNLKK